MKMAEAYSVARVCTVKVCFVVLQLFFVQKQKLRRSLAWSIHTHYTEIGL